MELFVLLIVVVLVVVGIPAAIAAAIVGLLKMGSKPETGASEPVVTDAQETHAEETAVSAEIEDTEPVIPSKPKKKMNASSVLMFIGTAFIILSAITFVAANWVKMLPEGRVFALAGAAVLAFVFSAVIKAAAKLEGTSVAFYTIGSVVSAVTLLTASGYELLGSWFSFSGDGAAAVMASTSIVLSAASFIGCKIYKRYGASYFGFSFISAALFFGCIQLTSNFEEFAPLIVLVQAVITASVHILKPQQGTVMEKSARTVGDVTAALFASIGMMYTFATVYEPTAFSFVILAVLMIQLAGYGCFKKQSWMFVVLDLLAVYTAFTAASLFDGERASVRFFSFTVLVIYLANMAFPKAPTACKAITFTAAVIGAVISICTPAGSKLLLDIASPVIVSAIIALHIFHKSAAVQTAAGIAAPILPFFTALFISGTLEDRFVDQNVNYISSYVFGGLVLLYMAVSALIIFLPKYAFSFHAKHPVQVNAIHYANMAVSGAIIMAFTNYTPVFMIFAVLAAVHFALSFALRNNVTAVSSVISLVLIISNALGHYFADAEEMVIWAMFSLFLAMVFAARIIFKDGIIVKKDGRIRVDVLLLSSWVCVLSYAEYGDISQFLFLISAAVFIAGFIRNNTGRDAAIFMLSISTLFAALAAFTRPFLIPDSAVIGSKINLTIFAMIGVAYKLIWRDHPKASKEISTFIFVFAFAGLILDGVMYTEVMNRIFILAVTAAVLILAFYTKSKTWFAASSASLVVITILSTREYFDKLGWWVYLFVVGVILIAIAAVNEALKKKGETMKSTVVRKFSDWTW